jgi:hypothetical protein
MDTGEHESGWPEMVRDGVAWLVTIVLMLMISGVAIGGCMSVGNEPQITQMNADGREK